MISITNRSSAFGYNEDSPNRVFPDGVDEIRAKQYLFLTQFTGGPALYTDRYGFNNMRDVHGRFPITPERAEAWLACMKEAMDEIGLEGTPREFFF